jgi:septation ring formation regulator EzrA
MQLAEHALHETAVMEYEKKIRNLEAEKQELFASQGSKKVTVSNLERQLESLQSQLNTARSELSEQQALYNQIK